MEMSRTWDVMGGGLFIALFGFFVSSEVMFSKAGALDILSRSMLDLEIVRDGLGEREMDCERERE